MLKQNCQSVHISYPFLRPTRWGRSCDQRHDETDLRRPSFSGSQSSYTSEPLGLVAHLPCPPPHHICLNRAEHITGMHKAIAHVEHGSIEKGRLVGLLGPCR